MATTGSSQTSQDNGASKVRKGVAPRIQRDNDTDNARNRATHQESRDRDEREHFHAGDTQDIERPQSSSQAQKREKGQEDHDAGSRHAGSGREREYNHPDSSHYNDDNRSYQSFAANGGNRSGSGRTTGRYEQVGHGANRRPNDGYGDPMNEVDRRYLSDDRGGERNRWREDDDRGHYDGNRVERDRYELNDRQNGWQANVRVDNRGDERRHRDDSRFQNNWQDRQWRETAYRGGGHEWRPNDDWRNEQRNGSEYDRDRGSYGNSRFRDDDYGYRTSRGYDRDYGRDDDRNDPRQPRGYTATSERDYDDRNPSRERDRNRRDR